MERMPQPSHRIDAITHTIDTVLAELEAEGIQEREAVEAEVWDVLHTGAEQGFYDIDEAAERFRCWYNSTNGNNGEINTHG